MDFFSQGLQAEYKSKGIIIQVNYEAALVFIFFYFFVIVVVCFSPNASVCLLYIQNYMPTFLNSLHWFMTAKY